MLNLNKNYVSFNKQVPKNLFANISYFILSILVGLLLVPYFIHSLGMASYGLIPLATSLTSYINLITQSLNSSVSRYLTIDLQKQDYKKANITFNTSLFGTLLITLLIIPVMVIVSYYSPLFFDIPINQRQDAFVLFLGVIGSLLVRTWGGNFGVSLFAFNRLDLQNIINSINLLLQILFIILFFSLRSPKLCYIGYSYFIAAIITILITILMSKKVNPYFKVKIQDFKSSRLLELMGTGSWITIDMIGSLLLLQMDIILVNKLFGTIAGGEYSIVLVWITLIRAISSILAGVLTPIFFIYYAQDKFEELISLSKSSVKLMGLAMAFPIGLICGFSPLILSLWVGPEYSRLSPLMWILLSHLAINTSVTILSPINVTFNKLRIPAIATILSGILNLILAIGLSSYTGLGYYGVAIASAVTLTIRNFFFIPIYATRLLGISNNPFKKAMIQVFISTLTVAGIASAVCNFFYSLNILTLIIIGIMSLSYLIIIWSILLNNLERKIIKSIIPINFVKIFKIEKKQLT